MTANEHIDAMIRAAKKFGREKRRAEALMRRAEVLAAEVVAHLEASIAAGDRAARRRSAKSA